MAQLHETENVLASLDEKVETLYRYQSVMNCYSLILRDYGTGIAISEVEAHTLNYIQAEEGLTATRLAEITNRTKSSISQIVSRLEKQGMISRKVNLNNKREYRIFVTEMGRKTCEAHQSYDREGMLAQINYLLKNCTPKEIDGFFKVLRYRILWFKRVNSTFRKKLNAQEKKRYMSARYTGC
ncbi:MarR family winged helix-turn-helix transcriptional regulator [Pyramidobacter sp. C12-8]|uniref:MarR family winged helix-turn-helix transcriptional regulator n=1 Tax=Pyramidobacter sp. C12-8 TaxID=1943580 RepID=UPI00098EF671|nr:MarR family transcriptional regulator [Pyramidobacter sp. C12-8]OON90076.1 hypothetical protein B0D78_00350 [Pyramidobacter sp. C12-8]